MSVGFKKLKGFLEEPPPTPKSPAAGAPDVVNGTPSTTISGLLPERIEFEPLIRTLIPAPGSPED